MYHSYVESQYNRTLLSREFNSNELSIKRYMVSSKFERLLRTIACDVLVISNYKGILNKKNVNSILQHNTQLELHI